MGLSSLVVFHHLVENSSAGGSLPQLNIAHHKVLLVGPPEHVSQISLELLPEQPPSRDLLYLYNLVPPLIEVDYSNVPLSISPVQALNQDSWGVPFEDPSESVDVYLQVEKVLLG